MPTCQAADLAAHLVGVQGGGGVLEATVAVRNTSGRRCGLEGYPGVQFVGAGGSVISATVLPGGSLPFEQVAPSPLILAPGETAEFNIGLPDAPSPGAQTCPSAQALRVEPPGSVDALVVSADVQVCGSAPVRVSAFFSTSSAASATAVPGG